MYALARHLTASQLLLREAPLMMVSLVVAELFYKLGSFTLEALAFLATWAVLDVAAQFVRPLARRSDTDGPANRTRGNAAKA
jgi:hypothetical protein